MESLYSDKDHQIRLVGCLDVLITNQDGKRSPFSKYREITIAPERFE